MTENELKIYRKIAVWRSRTVYVLLFMLATIPVMFFLYLLIGGFGADTDIGTILVFIIFPNLFLFVPYVICINRQIALTGYEPPLILSFILGVGLAGIITWPLYILFSLPVLVHSKKVLRQVKYTDDDFSYGDSDPFSGTSPEFPNRNNDTHPQQNDD